MSESKNDDEVQSMTDALAKNRGFFVRSGSGVYVHDDPEGEDGDVDAMNLSELETLTRGGGFLSAIAKGKKFLTPFPYDVVHIVPETIREATALFTLHPGRLSQVFGRTSGKKPMTISITGQMLALQRAFKKNKDDMLSEIVPLEMWVEYNTAGIPFPLQIDLVSDQPGSARSTKRWFTKSCAVRVQEGGTVNNSCAVLMPGVANGKLDYPVFFADTDELNCRNLQRWLAVDFDELSKTLIPMRKGSNYRIPMGSERTTFFEQNPLAWLIARNGHKMGATVEQGAGKDKYYAIVNIHLMDKEITRLRKNCSRHTHGMSLENLSLEILPAVDGKWNALRAISDSLSGHVSTVRDPLVTPTFVVRIIYAKLHTRVRDLSDTADKNH